MKELYIREKYENKMETLKSAWCNAKLGATQERIEDEMNELRYKWSRYSFKQCKKIGEWWLAHREGYIEKKESLLPYWEQYLEEIDEYLLRDKERTQLEEWEDVIYQETKNWRDGDEEDEDLFFDFDEDEEYYD